jgi:ankyrin repeat protein
MAREDVDLTLPDIRGRTPLHWACCFDYTLVSQLLQSNNVDPNARDISGHTPLAHALNDVRVVDLLLRRRDTDPNPVDNKGVSVLTMATDCGLEEIVSLLRAAGAK